MSPLNWKSTVSSLGLIFIVAGLAGCARYTVVLRYPKESANIFDERPATSLYVAQPADLRSQKEREGKGAFVSLRFPADDRLDVPIASVVRRALMQDILSTRVARLVQNPENADFLLHTQVLSMTTKLKRSGKQFAVPILAGIGIGFAAGAGADVGHGIKVGLVGVVLGTFIPLPTETEGIVELHLELRDQKTNELVWSTTCTGSEQRKVSISISARDDKKLAERFLPAALKRANACAVGQLYQFLLSESGTVKTGESPMAPAPADSQMAPTPADSQMVPTVVDSL
jgi:hypothetical protein